MEPGTFEDDEDRRTERTVIGAELTGRVNGLRVLIMRGRGCADCEKACDRKRRDGRTAHPNWPFNPLRRGCSLWISWPLFGLVRRFAFGTSLASHKKK